MEFSSQTGLQTEFLGRHLICEIFDGGEWKWLWVNLQKDGIWKIGVGGKAIRLQIP